MDNPEIQTEKIPQYRMIPTIEKFHNDGSQFRCIVGPVGCYSGDTEFLTERGWHRFDEYDGSQVPAQWSPVTKAISFRPPERFIKEPCTELIHFSDRHSISMVLSDEHRMPLYDYRGVFEVRQASEVAECLNHYTVPTTFRAPWPELDISDAQLRLMVASHMYGSLTDQTYHIVVRDQHKRDRLEWLLDAVGVGYTTTGVEYVFTPPLPAEDCSSWAWAWRLSGRQLAILVDELSYWSETFEGPDGSISAASQHDADFIQYAAHAVGGRATIETEMGGYTVHMALPGSYKSEVILRGNTTSIERIIPEDGFKYCFTVPSGFLVVRHNGRVFISGNSGKTTAAAWEVFYYLPMFIYEHYWQCSECGAAMHRSETVCSDVECNTPGRYSKVSAVKKTRGAIVRNTTPELKDTTQKTINEWFPWGDMREQRQILTVRYPDKGIEIEALFRACDNPKHVRQFRSMELTWYWIDESIEVLDAVKKMLKNRLKRFPRKFPVRWGIETTNPPDVEHTTYSQFHWISPPPGPIPSGTPLDNHRGFWQPPYENEKNLGKNYYEDLKRDYAEDLDWLQMYIEGKPGQLIQGALVYRNFDRHIHLAKDTLEWDGQTMYRGWDNSGNRPACIVVCPVSPQKLHIYQEFTTVKENIVDFTNRVIVSCNQRFPGAEWLDYCDPAGRNQYSTREGTFTSNIQLVQDECGLTLTPAEISLSKRINVVEQALLKRDGLLIDPSCVRLINGFLGGYHYQELTGMPGTYKDKPTANKYEDIQDALQYVCSRLHISAAPPVLEEDLYPDESEEATY